MLLCCCCHLALVAQSFAEGLIDSFRRVEKATEEAHKAEKKARGGRLLLLVVDSCCSSLHTCCSALQSCSPSTAGWVRAGRAGGRRHRRRSRPLGHSGFAAPTRDADADRQVAEGHSRSGLHSAIHIHIHTALTPSARPCIDVVVFL